MEKILLEVKACKTRMQKSFLGASSLGLEPKFLYE